MKFCFLPLETLTSDMKYWEKFYTKWGTNKDKTSVHFMLLLIGKRYTKLKLMVIARGTQSAGSHGWKASMSFHLLGRASSKNCWLIFTKEKGSRWRFTGKEIFWDISLEKSSEKLWYETSYKAKTSTH